MAGRRREPPQWERLLDVPLQLPGAVLTHPFGDEVHVYKVGVGATPGVGGRHAAGKVFGLLAPGRGPGLLTLKVDPDRGVQLVREHEAISPGYHTNKRHWISVTLDGSVDDRLVGELIEDSYDLVLGTLTARARFDVDPDRFPLPPRR